MAYATGTGRNDFLRTYAELLGDYRILGKEAVFYCPFPGCAGTYKRKLYVNMTKGFWQCKRCCQVTPNKTYSPNSRDPHGGTFTDFIKTWNYYYPSKAQDPNKAKNVTRGPVKDTPPNWEEAYVAWTLLFSSNTLQEESRQLILARGIDPDTAGMVTSNRKQWNQLLEVLGPEKMRELGLSKSIQRPEPSLAVENGRILIPNWQGDMVNSFVGYMRCPEQQENQPNEEYEYLRNCWVSYPGPLGFPSVISVHVPDGAKFTIVTEGQLKSLAAAQRGFPCIGLPGMGSCHGQAADYCLSKRIKRVVILLDEEPDKAETIDYQAERLSEALHSRGLQVYRANFPIEEGVKKMDLDLFLLENGGEALLPLIANAKPYTYDS